MQLPNRIASLTRRKWAKGWSETAAVKHVVASF
jgi:hypothetical protein